MSMIVPEFRDVAPVLENTLENYVATCASYPHCQKWISAMHRAGVRAANVDFTVAYAFVTAAVKKTIATCHPRDVLEEQLKVGPVVLSTGGIQALDSQNVPVDHMTTSAGFFLAEDRKKDMLAAWVSEAVAFQHTPSNSKGRVGITSMTITPAIEKSLCLATQHFNVQVPSNFSDNAIANSLGLFKMYVAPKLAGKVNHTLPLAHSQMSSEWVDHRTRVVTNPPPELHPYIVEGGDQSKKLLPIPAICQQDGKVVTTEKFYRVLRDHRDVRGADSGHVSALTAGYYVGTMSRALDKLLWQVVDILTITSAFKMTSVLFERCDLNTNVAAALVSNGLTVYVSSAKPVISKLFTSIDLTRTPHPQNCVYYSASYFTACVPTVTSKGIVGQPYSEFAALAKQFNDSEVGFLRMTHLYLLDYHGEFGTHIYPSIHCHAGHVIFVSKPANKEPMTMAAHFARMTLANKYKTAFPVRRLPFGVVDTRCPEVLTKGVKLASSIVSRLPNDIVYQDYDIKQIGGLKLAHEVEPLVFKSAQVDEVVHVKIKVDDQYIAPPVPKEFVREDEVVFSGVLDDVEDNQDDVDKSAEYEDYVES